MRRGAEGLVSAMSILVRVALVAAAAWLFVRWFEWRSVYVPSRAMAGDPSAVGLAFEDVQFMTEDARLLHGWWIPHEQARGTILYCHGNAGNISGRVSLCHDLHRLGVNVFIFDYRGYGRSKGWPTEQGTYRDARAAYEVVRARYGDAEDPPVIVYGASLGGAIACQLALDKPVRALVVESSFPSAVDVGEVLYPWLPVRAISRFRYDAARRAAQVRAPKLFASSRNDTLIPFELGRRLYDEAAPPKEFVELRGPHEEAAWETTPEYGRALARFVDRHLPAAPAAQ